MGSTDERRLFVRYRFENPVRAHHRPEHDWQRSGLGALPGLKLMLDLYGTSWSPEDLTGNIRRSVEAMDEKADDIF